MKRKPSSKPNSGIPAAIDLLRDMRPVIADVSFESQCLEMNDRHSGPGRTERFNWTLAHFGYHSFASTLSSFRDSGPTRIAQCSCYRRISILRCPAVRGLSKLQYRSHSGVVRRWKNRVPSDKKPLERDLPHVNLPRCPGFFDEFTGRIGQARWTMQGRDRYHVRLPERHGN